MEIKMYCKTFEDYIKTAKAHGFEVIRVEETRVNPDHVVENNDVNGLPLHLVVKLRKPESQMEIATNVMASANSLSMLPKKLNWSKVRRSSYNVFYVGFPPKQPFLHFIHLKGRHETSKECIFSSHP